MYLRLKIGNYKNMNLIGLNFNVMKVQQFILSIRTLAPSGHSAIVLRKTGMLGIHLDVYPPLAGIKIYSLKY
jgi:hypothetical protein